ncbi:outer membrane lipoprotein carrier protein LolA [Solidesulfovibrio fructosivorans JJ]]|uniref:Outer membrane lipoprotein carrier protein LolA n=1 Tax=Solidesulfovibrio fructosivorans JJ] TaxID=596151 RepID=E1JYU5_SOLFR|nr:outer membrane lipoprotein carrier protein LolA [Solidesulfovibrio fructosivorans]EFL50515.1 outer membrane lipoprotein carrier protein LolA [Solidesulfovibrio fructosivorans JJ]]
MKKRAFFLAVCFVLATAATARAVDPTELAGRIQNKYATINAFSASFTQAIRNAASGDTEHRSGSFFFKKPVLVRWETVKPEKELLIVGKDAVWDYFEEDKEAYRYAVKEIISSKTMLRFLTGKANLTEDFFVAAGKASDAGPGQAVLDLAPREPEPGLVMARVWVDLSTDMIARVFIQDFYANTNDLTLTGVAVNPKLADTLFTFTPPKDAKVHDNAPAKERDLK